MFVYKTNLFFNKNTQSIIEDFETNQKAKIINFYNLNNIQSDKIQSYQIINEYFKVNNDLSYLLIYQIHLKTKKLIYRIIRIDTEDIERLKTKIWRINGKEIVFTKLEPKSLKKISHISIKCFLMNIKKVEILFRTNDKNDYRKSNFKIHNKIKERSLEKNQFLIKKYKKSTNDFIQKIDFDKFSKKYQLLNQNNNGIKQNIYYKYSENDIALIVTMDNINFYLSLIDYDKLNLIKNHFWNLHFPDKRHPKHNVYLEKWMNIKKIRLHSFIFFNGNIKKILNNHLIVDHINRNPLDNRKENLRLVSISENNRNQNTRRNNTSGITGVRLNEQKNAWISVRTIYPNGRFQNPKARSLKSSFFDDAVLNRKKLEILSDKDFLSNISTSELFKKYEKEKKFNNLIEEFDNTPV